MRTLTRADSVKPLPERLRIRAEYAGTWIGLQVVPSPLMAWVVRQRCLARKRALRRQARRRARRAARS